MNSVFFQLIASINRELFSIEAPLKQLLVGMTSQKVITHFHFVE
jgi:hypothetical protein